MRHPAAEHSPGGHMPDVMKIWTRRELAQHMGVGLSTIDRWIAAKELDTVQIGRIRRIPDTSVQDLIARRLQPAADNVRKPGRRRRAS